MRASLELRDRYRLFEYERNRQGRRAAALPALQKL